MKVTTTKTKKELKIIEDHVFDQLLKALECDTLSDEGCIAFSGSYSVDQYAKRQTYKIEFFAHDIDSYEVIIPLHINYVKSISFIGEPSIMTFVDFTKAQKAQIQDLISKKAVEVKEDKERQKTAYLRDAIGFNPYQVFGVKESDFLNV